MKQEKAVEFNDMVRTDLTWDKYIDYLIETINESKFMKRAEDKPMSAPKGKLEPHLTSRATHERNAADIAKRIAKALGLNENYVYSAMLMHDAGHPFSAHDGEEYFTGIGQLYNIQYFHHNAKGIEVINNENICEKAISKIPEAKNNPELKRELEEEFPYFFDIVISHDGEARREDMNKRPNKYVSIKQAVETKLNMSNAHNKHKCVAQFPEGRIAMYADVLSYLPTDIRDRFRLGIHKGFSDEYLELFGRLFNIENGKEEKNNKQVAIQVLEEIQMSKIRELKESIENKGINTEKNRKLAIIAKGIASQITSQVENFEHNEDKVAEIINQNIDEYITQHSTENMGVEDKKFLKSDVSKIKHYIGEFLRVRTKVVEEMTSRMREFFINNLIETSKQTGKLGFSNPVKDLFFDFKQLNYDFVHKTKWDYQLKAQPVAADSLVSTITRCLLKTGVIADRFYDTSIRDQITNQEALSFMTTKYRDEGEYIHYQKIAGMQEMKISNQKYTGGEIDHEKAYKELFKNVFDYVKDQDATFAQKYMNTYYAIEDQITRKVDHILGRLDEEEMKSRKTFVKYFDNEMIKEDEEALKELMVKSYGSLENIHEEERRNIINKLTFMERSKMEEKMCAQMAIDYLSGMTDRGFNELAIQTGLVDKDIVRNSKRGNADTGRTGQLSNDMQVDSHNGTER